MKTILSVLSLEWMVKALSTFSNARMDFPLDRHGITLESFTEFTDVTVLKKFLPLHPSWEEGVRHLYVFLRI